MRLLWLQFRRRYFLNRLRRKNLPDFMKEYLEAFNWLDLKQPIGQTEFVVFDTETTGLNVKRGDRILSLSAVRLKNGRIDLSDTFHEFVNPNRDIPSKTAVIHEILPRMVDGKPSIDQILPKFIAYVGSSVLVAHHEWLDMSFLNWEMNRLYGFPMLNIVLDTALLDQALVLMKTPAFMRDSTRLNSTLGAVAERYRITIEQQHSSFWDALATAQIFQKMIKEAQQRKIVLLKELIKVAITPPGLGAR